jgi:hypothetical protein
MTDLVSDGGKIGQVLVKTTNNEFTTTADYDWQNAPGGNIAGLSPDEVGVVYVKPSFGISLGDDGGLAIHPTTPDQIGGIVDSPWNNMSYARSNGQWVETSSAVPTILVQDTPPNNAVPNQLWWDSNSGDLFIRYQDMDSTQWVQINTSGGSSAVSGAIGDVKQGFQINDHGGWIKLDGRDITTLTATQQTAAASLGFTTNLPDATSAIPLQNGGVMGEISGSWVLTQANLPNINVANAGNHQHRSYGHEGGAAVMFEFATENNWNNDFNGAWLDGTTYQTESFLMAAAGDHSHSLGGSGTAITPLQMAVNTFCYLGD